MNAVTAAVLGLVLLAAAGDGWAQKTGVRRVAYLATTSPLAELTGRDPVNPSVRGFVHRLRELGYEEGRNLALDMRTLAGDWSKIEAIGAGFAQGGAEVIVLATSALVPAVRKAAPGTPIVMLGSSDILGAGLVDSLSRPGRNITGINVDIDPEIEAKRLEMLVQLKPATKRVAYVATREDFEGNYGRRLQSAAQRLGLTLIRAEGTRETFASGFEQAAREKADALLVTCGPLAYGFRRQIGERAAASGVPSSCAHGEAVAHGCLMSYGASLVHVLRRAADYVARILEGANAGELPIEQPTVFELEVNLKTARALGVEVPGSILLRAHRIIE